MDPTWKFIQYVVADAVDQLRSLNTINMVTLQQSTIQGARSLREKQFVENWANAVRKEIVAKTYLPLFINPQ